MPKLLGVTSQDSRHAITTRNGNTAGVARQQGRSWNQITSFGSIVEERSPQEVKHARSSVRLEALTPSDQPSIVPAVDGRSPMQV